MSYKHFSYVHTKPPMRFVRNIGVPSPFRVNILGSQLPSGTDNVYQCDGTSEIFGHVVVEFIRVR